MPELAEFRPKWATPPGLTIKHILLDRQMTLGELAEKLNRSLKFVIDLIIGREEITAGLAEELSQTVGSTPRFWLAREQGYRESLAQLARDSHELASWAAQLPISDMKRLGWLRQSSGLGLVAECLQFFGVSSIERWHESYESAILASSFRTSAAFETDAGATSVWLRQGEIDALRIHCREWNPLRLRQVLPEIRSLTRISKPARFLPELQKRCSVAGVVVVVTPAPEGCRASGAARFLSDGRALIQLSQRYRSDDQFWFTFFHEAAHLLLHKRAQIFIDDPEGAVTREEKEANDFAANILLDSAQRTELARTPLSYDSVIRFALRVGISPGIVVGQLQHSKRIGFNHLNKAKRKLDWSTETNG